MKINGNTLVGHCTCSQSRISTENLDSRRNNLNRSLLALEGTDFDGKTRCRKEQSQSVTDRARKNGLPRKTPIGEGTTSIGHCSRSRQRISTENRDSGRNNLNRSMFALAGTDFNGEPRFGEEQPQSHTVLARTDGFRLKTPIQGGKTSIGHCSRSQERISTEKPGSGRNNLNRSLLAHGTAKSEIKSFEPMKNKIKTVAPANPHASRPIGARPGPLKTLTN